jgi:signal transduction histidine kinase
MLNSAIRPGAWQVNQDAGLKALPTWTAGLLYVSAYVGVVWLSLRFLSIHLGIVPWGPETGLCFAAFLIFGKRIWPFLLLAVAAANLLLRGSGLPMPVQIFAPFIIGGGYAIALSILVSPRLRFDAGLRTSRDVQLLLTTAVVSTVAIACAYVTLLLATGALPRSEVASAVYQFATADLIGITVITPFLLLLAHASRLPRLTIEGGLQAMAIVASFIPAFAVTGLPHFRLFNAVFFPIIWIALRQGLQGATYGLLLTQAGLIVALVHLGEQAGSMAAFQGLMLVIAFTGLSIGTLVTERRRVEQQLRLNEKSIAEIFRLGSAGELATAIAHEINQPLTAIANYTQIIQHYLEDGYGDRTMAIEAAKKVSAQVGRTDAVIRSFRDLIKRGRPEMKPETVGEIFRETLDIVAPLLQREGVDVEVSIARDTQSVLADRLQIQQVLINLMANATEAMAKNRDGDKRLFLIASNAPGGDGVAITVADTGPGFPKGVDIRRPALFTSSKPDGLGVGLSFSRSIVENHGGEMQVGGGPGGAVVSIKLRKARIGAEP